jgi:hypothetical protein
VLERPGEDGAGSWGFRLVPGVLAFLITKFALHLSGLLSVSIAVATAVRLPPLAGRQQRTRLAASEVFALVVFIAILGLAATSVAGTATAISSAGDLHRAETSLEAGRPADALALLRDAPSVSAPRVAVDRACAHYALGHHELAWVFLQSALVFGAQAPVTASVRRCFLERPDVERQFRYLMTKGGWAILLPTDQAAQPWVLSATDAAKGGDATSALIFGACAQHLAGNRLVAALLLTIGLRRLGVRTPNVLREAVDRLPPSQRRCVRSLARSRNYDIVARHDGLVVRPNDYLKRLKQ